MQENYYLFFILALLAEILGTVSGFGSSILFVPLASIFLDFKVVLGITAVFHVFSNLSKLILFQKNIEMLLSHLQANEINNIMNLVFSDTGKQIERLIAIIQDRQKQINVVPIYHGLAEGFLEQDLDRKSVV